jgi:putative ABC transport system substrate-binding protein
VSELMKRREFVILLGGVAAAWPRAARAQQERTRHVGMITAGSDENDPEAQANCLAFVHAMHQLGWVEGRICGSIISGAAASPKRFASTWQT